AAALQGNAPKKGNETTFAAARRAGGVVHLDFYRLLSRVRRETIPAADLGDGPLRLEASRAGERVTLQVNGRRPLEFRDVLPLRAPDGVGLDRVWASRGVLPAVPSPLERGDDAFGRGDHDRALDEYRAQDVAAATPDVRLEARYKQALCYLRLNREAEAVALLEEVAAAPGESPAVRHWAARADCQLWLVYLRRKDEEGRARADPAFHPLCLRAIPVGELAGLVSEEERLRIIDGTGLGGDYGQYTHPESVLPRLERAVEVLDLLQGDWYQRVATREQLARTYRFAGREGDAARV